MKFFVPIMNTIIVVGLIVAISLALYDARVLNKNNVQWNVHVVEGK